MAAAAFDQIDAVLANAVQNGADLVLAFDGGTITMANTNLAAISHGDFKIAA